MRGGQSCKYLTCSKEQLVKFQLVRKIWCTEQDERKHTSIIRVTVSINCVMVHWRCYQGHRHEYTWQRHGVNCVGKWHIPNHDISCYIYLYVDWSVSVSTRGKAFESLTPMPPPSGDAWYRYNMYNLLYRVALSITTNAPHFWLLSVLLVMISQQKHTLTQGEFYYILIWILPSTSLSILQISVKCPYSG